MLPQQTHQKEKTVKAYTTETVKDHFAVFLTLEFIVRYAEERKAGLFFFFLVLCAKTDI